MSFYIQIIRTKKKDKYTHHFTDKKGKSIKQVKVDFYIAPAYDNVKINMNKNAKVLAIGYDDKNRPQYIYNQNQIKNQDHQNQLLVRSVICSQSTAFWSEV